MAYIFIELAVRSAIPVADAATSSRSQPGWFSYLIIGLLVIRPIYEVLSWWMRTYSVGEVDITVDEGIFTRHHRVIPFARVQQVDLDQRLTSQVLGVQVVRISAAGEAGATTVALHSLERGEAEELRRFILQRREELHAGGSRRSSDAADAAPADGPGVPVAWVVDSSGALTAPVIATRAPDGPPPGAPFAERRSDLPTEERLRLSSGRLALAGITDSKVLIVPTVAFVVTLWIVGFVTRNEATPLLLTTFAIAFGVLAAATLFVTAVLVLEQVIKKHAFTLTTQGDDLHLRYGLFDVHQLTIPRRRVQQVTIIDNPLRRLIGVASLRLHSAALGTGQSTTTFDIPVLPRSDIDGFLTVLMGSSAWHLPELTPRSDRARTRAVVRRFALLGLALLGPALLLPPYGPLLLALSLLGFPWGLIAHRRAGHGRSDRIIAFSHGVLQHRVDLVPIDRIQSCRTTSTPFQRRAGLATLLTDVAAALVTPRLYDMEAAVAADLIRALPRR